MSAHSHAVRDHLLELQDAICTALETVDGREFFSSREIVSDSGGLQRPRVLEDGARIEKAAVHFTHSRGRSLPPAATERRPELAGEPYEAVSVSLIVHPGNPKAPTSHANFRFFTAGEGDTEVWWFGGGFDLTPYYGYDEDCAHWHRTARRALEAFGPDVYDSMREACDRYFYLPHRDEPRGIGGVFYDDLSDGGFERCFAVHRAASGAYLDAYLPILERRADLPFTAEQRRWQCVRRGRYAEFNLLYDRGTRFGLEAGGRVESILASMPPVVEWHYDHQPRAGSEEARLLEHFLVARDWARDESEPRREA